MKGVDALGWVATVLFLTSYTCRSQRALRLTQAGAAGVWALYGVLLHAVPIIVANLLVAAVAVYSSRSRGAASSLDGGPGARITTSGQPDLSRIS